MHWRRLQGQRNATRESVQLFGLLYFFELELATLIKKMEANIRPEKKKSQTAKKKLDYLGM